MFAAVSVLRKYHQVVKWNLTKSGSGLDYLGMDRLTSLGRGMEVEFAEKNLDRLETDRAYNAGFSQEIVRAFRKLMQVIRAAPDERTFYALKSLHYEKLKGDRSHQHSMRLNKQWRLIVEIKTSEPGNIVVVVSIEDYH